MTWTDEDYPPEMGSLDADARHRAVALANELVAQGYPAPEAVETAIKRLSTERPEPVPGEGTVREAEKDVTPHEEGWAVASPHGEHQTFVYEKKEDALRKARERAASEDADVHVHDGGEHIVNPDDADTRRGGQGGRNDG